MKRIPSFGCIAALSLVAGTSMGDEVLYDALVTNVNAPFPYNSASTSDFLPSSIGGSAILGKDYDGQAADDFELMSASTLTTITFDSCSFLGFVHTGYLVEFFADENGAPSEEPTASATVEPPHYQAITSFRNAGRWGLNGNESGHRIELTLDGGVALDAGTWWVSVVGISDASDTRLSIFRQYSSTTGHPAHYRDGGLDHGNGYIGFHDVDDWTRWGDVGPSGLVDGDLAIRIEGTSGAECPADFSNDGALNFFDVSAFLGLFSAQDPAADMNTDGMFNFFDVSAFLSAFSAGCP